MIRVMRAHRQAPVVVLAGLLLLAGCADNGQPVTPTPSSTTPAEPAAATSTLPPPPTTTSSAPPEVEPVLLTCKDPKTYESQEVWVYLDPQGALDNPESWAQRLECDNEGSGQQTVPVRTDLQRDVVAAARPLGYGAGDTDEQLLFGVYQACASNDPEDYYATADDIGEEQAAELTVWMSLCPKHPHAAEWKKTLTASKAVWKAEAAGERFNDGTYTVPGQVKPGRYVVKDVENCYWETRDSNGNILDNNFVTAAPRVQATVGRSATVLTVRGCGLWVKQ